MDTYDESMNQLVNQSVYKIYSFNNQVYFTCTASFQTKEMRKVECAVEKQLIPIAAADSFFRFLMACHLQQEHSLIMLATFSTRTFLRSLDLNGMS